MKLVTTVHHVIEHVTHLNYHGNEKLKLGGGSINELIEMQERGRRRGVNEKRSEMYFKYLLRMDWHHIFHFAEAKFKT